VDQFAFLIGSGDSGSDKKHGRAGRQWSTHRSTAGHALPFDQDAAVFE